MTYKISISTNLSHWDIRKIKNNSIHRHDRDGAASSSKSVGRTVKGKEKRYLAGVGHWWWPVATWNLKLKHIGGIPDNYWAGWRDGHVSWREQCATGTGSRSFKLPCVRPGIIPLSEVNPTIGDLIPLSIANPTIEKSFYYYSQSHSHFTSI